MSIKIYNISATGTILKPQSKSITFRGQEKETQTVSEPISLNKSPLAVLGKSNVIDRNAEFQSTIHNNWLELPEGAFPDGWQIDAAKSVFNGENTLVTVPTGAGKTQLAHYLIHKNLKEGKTTAYTAPIKALCNEKFKLFKEKYGEENVGLLTGDTKINTEAPIKVMTTEVYRNMVLSNKFKTEQEQRKPINAVIFDELHYLGDADRGGTWEQSIILAPKDTQMLSLSATVGNDEQINNWMSKTRSTKQILISVPPEERHVPLEEFRVKSFNLKSPLSFEVTNFKLMKELKVNDKLPVIFFVFSKRKSKKLLEFFKKSGVVLNSPDKENEVEQIINKYKENGKYLGENLDIDALKKGYAIHNSGLLPMQKELVEELFQKKLLKTVIATETLGAGINMPARTVIITDIRKHVGAKYATEENGKRLLTVNEVKQMLGRAGRRNIDTKGFFYIHPTEEDDLWNIQRYIKSKPGAISNNFEPNYSFITKYYSHTQDDKTMKEIISNSLAVYDDRPEIAEEKTYSILEKFNAKKAILQKFGYLNQDKTLTPKGKLLSELNGYHQIPVIDIIFNKKLAAASPAELAGCVGSMALLSEEAAEHKNRFQEKSGKNDFAKRIKVEKFKSGFKHENNYLSWFVNDTSETLEKYNNEMSNNPKFYEIAQNEDAAKRLYDWAYLNSTNPDSKQNWRMMCRKHLGDYVDEGSIFKEITQTVDLIKQMSEIANVGLKNVTSQEDGVYFKQLKNTIEETVKLISKEPIPRSCLLR
jgi:superfamily II RNA helicase